MEESNILIAIITLGVGGVIGYFAGRTSTISTQSPTKQVDELKIEINQYKDSVASHFQQTATMINEMNESYKSVISHLTQGSQELLDAGTAKEIESRLVPQTENQEDKQKDSMATEQDESIVEPPRDYAPKGPDELGALSENYGISVKSQEDDENSEDTLSPPFDNAIKH